jgi:hypothetical protein
MRVFVAGGSLKVFGCRTRRLSKMRSFFTEKLGTAGAKKGIDVSSLKRKYTFLL